MTDHLPHIHLQNTSRTHIQVRICFCKAKIRQWHSQGGGLRGLEPPPLRWSGYAVNGSGQQAATA